MTILDQLAGCARERTGQAKLRISLEELKQQRYPCRKEILHLKKQSKNQDFLLSASAKKPLHPKGSLLRSFHICRLQRTMKRQGQTASRY